MPHDAVDTSVRSRRLNGVTAAAIDKTAENKSNGNGVPSSATTTSDHSSLNGAAEVKHTTSNGVHVNTSDNNYGNGRKGETCNGNTTAAATSDDKPSATEEQRLSLMRGPLHNNVPFIPQFRWPDLIVQICLHTGAAYGLLFQFYSIKFYTFIWCKWR